MAIAKFCPECGTAVAGAKFCPECGTPTALGIGEDEAAPLELSHEEQVAILENEIAELAKQGWHLWSRATPYEVCLRRKSGLTARQFLPLWVEWDGSLWTNSVGAVEGGRLRNVPSLFFNRQVRLDPTPWRSAPAARGENVSE